MLNEVPVRFTVLQFREKNFCVVQIDELNQNRAVEDGARIESHLESADRNHVCPLGPGRVLKTNFFRYYDAVPAEVNM